MTDPIDEVAWLRWVEEAMTPGGWWTEGQASLYAHIPGGRPNGEGLFSTDRYYSRVNGRGTLDATGIAALRNLAPAMLAVIEAAEHLDGVLSLLRCPVPGCKYCAIAAALKAFRAAVREEMSR